MPQNRYLPGEARDRGAELTGIERTECRGLLHSIPASLHRRSHNELVALYLEALSASAQSVSSRLFLNQFGSTRFSRPCMDYARELDRAGQSPTIASN